MDRGAYSANASASAPSAPASPSAAYPTDGDPLTALPATIPGAWWFHVVTEEIRNAIVAAGLTPDYEDPTQLALAIQALATNGASVAEMIAATLTDKSVTPGRLKYSPMAIKKVIKIPGAGSDGAVSPIINLGGTARAERKGTGWYRVLFSTTGSGDDMASGTYVVLGWATDSSAPTTVGSWGGSITPTMGNIAVIGAIAQDATGFIAKCEGAGGAGARDPVDMTFIVLGVLP